MQPDIIESRAVARRWDYVAGLRIHAREAVDQAPANARPVVLVHGLGMSSRYMSPTIEILARSHPTYAPDLPGFGLSDSPGKVLDLGELADFLGVWIEQMGLSKPALVANSVGCQIVIELALKRPSLLDRIVLQGPTMARRRRSWVSQLARQQWNDAREPDSLARINSQDSQDSGQRRLFWTLEAALWDRSERKLPRIQIPALVVRGKDDPICPQDWAEEVVRLLPNGRLLVVPEVTHTMNYVASDRLVGAILPFMSEPCQADPG